MATTPFLPFDKQTELLEGRGLTIANKEYAIKVLANVNYYRFSAYSLTLRTAQQLLGHASIEMTARIYTHLEAEDGLKVSGKLDNYFNSAPSAAADKVGTA